MRAQVSAAHAPTPVETQLAASPAPGKDLPAFRRVLLAWYDRHRRELPWRKTRDPYRIWLSEIMLQQTRVAAVLEHYRVFLERFPNVRALAAASEDAVVAAWSGLGYYRRARSLHQCARQVVDQNGGRFPNNSKALLGLPGIGRYTAAAIASIAFDEPVAVVDGNVERVLQRIAGRNLPPDDIWPQAQSLLSKSRPGDFNQALMELGATVCTPRQPKCPVCPMRKWCATQGEIQPDRLPSKQKKKKIWCALEQRDGHVRLVQRSPRESLMAGMWELPQWTQPAHQTPDSEPAPRRAAKRRKIAAHGASRGSEVRNRRAPEGRKNGSDVAWRTFRHSVTVTDYTVHVIRGAVPAAHTYERARWIAIADLAGVPITGLTRKILRAGGII
ncbi:MAG: A/G-specific adenine glycosylase [Terriglobales bacterium]